MSKLEQKLLDRYASKRQLNKYVIPQILLHGFIQTDEITLMILGLEESVFSLAQNIHTRYYEIWENTEYFN